MNDKLVLIKILNCVANEIIGKKIYHPLPACSEVIETAHKILPEICQANPEKIGGSINYPRMVRWTIKPDDLREKEDSSYSQTVFWWISWDPIKDFGVGQGNEELGNGEGGSGSGLDRLDSAKEEDVKVEVERV